MDCTKSDADIIRELIQHKGHLMHHRMMWMGTTEGLLFAAFGLMWQGILQQENETHWTLWLSMALLALCGWAIAGSTLYAQILSTNAIARMEEDICNQRKTESQKTDWPPVIASSEKELEWWEKWLLPWRAIPFVFAFAWTMLLVLLFFS